MYDRARDYAIDTITDSLAYANTTNGISDQVGATHPGQATVVGGVRPGIRTGVGIGFDIYVQLLRLTIGGTGEVVAADEAATESLARILQGHGPGQGFTGVFGAATGRVALRPSTADAVIPAGWVPRAGGHAVVSAELGGAAASHAGFAAIIEEGTVFV